MAGALPWRSQAGSSGSRNPLPGCPLTGKAETHTGTRPKSILIGMLPFPGGWRWSQWLGQLPGGGPSAHRGPVLPAPGRGWARRRCGSPRGRLPRCPGARSCRGRCWADTTRGRSPPRWRRARWQTAGPCRRSGAGRRGSGASRENLHRVGPADPTGGVRGRICARGLYTGPAWRRLQDSSPALCGSQFERNTSLAL